VGTDMQSLQGKDRKLGVSASSANLRASDVFYVGMSVISPVYLRGLSGGRSRTV